MGRFSNEWYTYKHQDICAVYSVFQKLYEEFIKPKYGASKRCKITYDRELSVFFIKLDRKPKIKIFGNTEEALYMKKFIRLLTVSGLIGTPLYKIKVSFTPDLSKMHLMHKRNLLISQSGSNNHEGLYYLKGELT